jgi:hypothetical protein
MLLVVPARAVDDRSRVYQLEGFGWQWTCDRYDDNDRKYLRFQDADYPRYEDRPVKEKGRDAALTVYDYQPMSNMKCPTFVLKGSADVLGGPGVTTRRYSANPLRAYPNVGFRIVVPEE